MARDPTPIEIELGKIWKRIEEIERKIHIIVEAGIISAKQVKKLAKLLGDE